MTTPYRVISASDALLELAGMIRQNRPPVLACDTETTGLDSRADRLRLISYLPCPWNLTPAPEEPVRLVDCWVGNPDTVTELMRRLAEFRLIFHNSLFDLGWFFARGVFPTQKVYDTQPLSKLVLAGTRGQAYGVFRNTSLEKVAWWFTQTNVDKSQQTSPWSRPHLTEEQLQYAALDVSVLPRILRELQHRITADKIERAAAIEVDSTPCMAWMSSMGVPFCPQLWDIPYRESLLRRQAAFTLVRGYLTDSIIADTLRTGEGPHRDPKRAGQLRFGFAYEDGLDRLLGSPLQLITALRKLGYPYPGTGDDYLAAWDHPLGPVLRDYREAEQIRKNFGPKWGRSKVSEDEPTPVRNGRVYPRWKQNHAEPGRMACDYPNLQNIPAPGKHPLGKQFRQAIKAPKGRELVKADFSQMELRIAAEISGDEAMRGVYARGGDIHTEAACWVLGIPDPKMVKKDDRTIMKSANFGLLYGAGVDRFRVYAASQFGLTLTPEQGYEIRENWFRAFPGIRAWHRQTGNIIDSKKEITTRTLTGRARRQVDKYTEALNTPVQGTGADITKLALARIYANRDNAPVPAACAYSVQGWYPVAVIHDEIVLEVPEGSGEAMAGWLKDHMNAAGNAVLKSVPCGVECSWGQSWVS